MSSRARTVLAAVAAVALAGGGWVYYRMRSGRAEGDGGAPASTAGMILTSLRALPADAFVAGALTNVTAFGEKMKATAFGKLAGDAAVRDKAKTALAATLDPHEAADLMTVVGGAGEVADLGIRSLVFAVLPLPDGSATPVGGGAIVACDDPARVAAWLDAKMAATRVTRPVPAPATPTAPAAVATTAAAQAATPGTATPGATPGTATAATIPAATASTATTSAVASSAAAPGDFPAPSTGPSPSPSATSSPTTSPAPTPATSPAASPAPLPGSPATGSIGGVAYTCWGNVCRAVRSNTLVVGAPLEALRRLLEAPSENGLAESPRLRKALDASAAAADSVFLFADLRRIVGAAKAEAARHDPEDAKVFQVLGLDSLDWLAFAESVDGAAFRDRLSLTYDAPAGELLGALLESPPKALTLDRLFPATATVTTFGSFHEPAATFDRFLASLRKTMKPEDAAKFDAALTGFPAKAGLDVRNDLFASFGGEWGVSYSVDLTKIDPARPETATAGLDLLVVLGVKDQAKIEALLGRLEETVKAMLPIQAATVGDGKIRTTAVPLAPGLAPAIGLASGKLVIGSSAASVRGLLEGTLPPLADDAAYKEMRARFRQEASGVTYTRTAAGTADRLLAGLAKAAAARGAQDRTAGTAAPPPEVAALAAALETHLASWPASMGVWTGVAGTVEADWTTPLEVATAPALLGALSLPQLFEAIERGRETRTRADLQATSAAVEKYVAAHGAPPAAASIVALEPLVVPTYLPRLAHTDAWGTPFTYAADGKHWVLASAGKDRKLEEDWTRCLAGCADRSGPAAEAGADLVFVDGAPLRWPARAEK